MTIEIDAPILEPETIARQFIVEALNNLQQARQQAQIEYQADCEREAALTDRQRRAAATRRGWQGRKARAAGAVAPVGELEDDE